MTSLTEQQKYSVTVKAQDLIKEIIGLADSSKDLAKILEALYKLKFRFEHQSKVQEIAPNVIDRKAIRDELMSLIQ